MVFLPSLACTAQQLPYLRGRLWTYYTELRQIAALGWLGPRETRQRSAGPSCRLTSEGRAPFHLLGCFHPWSSLSEEEGGVSLAVSLGQTKYDRAGRELDFNVV